MNKEYFKDYYNNITLNNPDKIKENIERSKLWQKNNKERSYESHKKWRDKNREILNKKAKLYRENNREKYLATRTKNRQKTKNDPVKYFRENVRGLITKSFRRGDKIFKKKQHTEVILGCSIDDFIKYILSKCPPNIGLKDFKKFGYHIDHIIPLKTAKSQEDIIKLNHYTNLQPLWWRDNLAKNKNQF